MKIRKATTVYPLRSYRTMLVASDISRVDVLAVSEWPQPFVEGYAQPHSSLRLTHRSLLRQDFTRIAKMNNHFLALDVFSSFSNEEQTI